MKSAQAHKFAIATARKRGIKGSPLNPRIKEIMSWNVSLAEARAINAAFPQQKLDDIKFLMIHIGHNIPNTELIFENVAPIMAFGHDLKTSIKIFNRGREISIHQ